MEYRNTLPEEEAFCDDKGTPSHVFSEPDQTPPSYSAPDAEPPQCQNVKWTPSRCARYDYFLHIASLVFGTPTLAIYAFDLAKSLSYHVKLPVGLAVVDALSITFVSLSLSISLCYLLSDMHTRSKEGRLSRKWPTIIDACLHTCLVAMADTTLSMRSGDSNCVQNGAVGGCESSRQGIMIAGGILMIFLAVAGQFRWAVTLHARRERKKLAKAAASHPRQSQQNLNWSNEIR